MVTLVNRLRTMQVFNLPHAIFCAENACACEMVTTKTQDELPDGTKGIREHERLLASSVTLLGKETKDFPDRIQLVPEVKAALDRGDLRLIQQAVKVVSPAPKPPVKVPDEAPRARFGRRGA